MKIFLKSTATQAKLPSPPKPNLPSPADPRVAPLQRRYDAFLKVAAHLPECLAALDAHFNTAAALGVNYHKVSVLGAMRPILRALKVSVSPPTPAELDSFQTTYGGLEQNVAALCCHLTREERFAELGQVAAMHAVLKAFNAETAETSLCDPEYVAATG